MEFFIQNTHYLPHGHCYYWEPYLLWSHAIADAIIAIAYIFIPVLLLNIYRQRQDFRYNWIVVLFAIFILGCGITHIFDVINLWNPFYYIDSAFRILTALASLGTALAFMGISKALLHIPTARQWEGVNATLQQSVWQLEAKEKQLQATNRELEKQVKFLHLAQQLSKVGSYEVNFEESFTIGSPQLHEIFGLDPGQAGLPIHIGFFYDKVHPDDLSYINEKLNELSDEKTALELSYRIVIDGQVKYISISSLDFKDETGKRISYGSVVDLSDRKQSELQLEQLNAELASSNEELASSNEELSVTTEELITNNEQLSVINLKLWELQQELEKRVTERTLELEHTSRELLERNEELDQYVYKVSHDIRAPVASVMGLISLMKQENNPPATQQYLLLVENRIAKLDDFIRSVLNYSKILNTTSQKTEINFAHIVEQCLDELTYYPDAHKLHVRIRLLTDKKFEGDELRLLIVFKNMISNAIKYRNKETESYLMITISNDGQGFVIRFEDNGIGIEEQYLEKIFQMFFRATPLSDGSGLGLYIVRQAVERMHGKMTVTSTVQQGTTFSLFLPEEAD